MGAGLKDFFLHKLVLRVGYIIAAFSVSHLLAFTSSSLVQETLSHAGVLFQVTDPDKLRTYVTGLLLAVGEFVYYHGHNKFVLPQVQPKEGGNA